MNFFVEWEAWYGGYWNRQHEAFDTQAEAAAEARKGRDEFPAIPHRVVDKAGNVAVFFPPTEPDEEAAAE